MNALSAGRQLLRQYSQQLLDTCFLGLAFISSLILSPLVVLPYKNPHNISNPFDAIGFNPESNFYVLLFVIVATLGLFYLFRYLYQHGRTDVFKAIIVGLFLFNYVFIALIPSLGYMNEHGVLDNFHAGEQLSGGSEFLAGKEPYSEMFFLRGAGVDAVIPAAVFSLFGRSIGVFIIAMDVLELLAIFSFSVLLAYLIKNPLKYVTLLSLFYMSAATSLVQFRDVFAWIVIGLLFLVFTEKIRSVYKYVGLAAIGFISSFTLFISIDRGVMLLALAVLLMVTLLFIESDAKNVYRFNKTAWKRNRDSFIVAAGIIVGFGVPGLMLGTDGFAAFVTMTFVDIPAFGGLLVSQPLPVLFSDKYLFWAPVFVAVTTGHLLIKLYGTKAAANLNMFVPLVLIFVFAVLCLKVGSNRIHLAKMASVTAPLYLIAILVLGVAIVYAYKHRQELSKLAIPIVLAVITLGAAAQLDATKLFYTATYTRAQLSQYKNTVHRSDDSLISPETKQMKDYIISKTNNDDYIFAFTADPVYYYLTDRRNPSRFSITWFADPQPYTNELLCDLKARKPKLIIYTEQTWMDAPDGIAIKDRVPEVDVWIRENYPQEKHIGTTTLRFKD